MSERGDRTARRLAEEMALDALGEVYSRKVVQYLESNPSNMLALYMGWCEHHRSGVMDVDQLEYMLVQGHIPSRVAWAWGRQYDGESQYVKVDTYDDESEGTLENISEEEALSLAHQTISENVMDILAREEWAEDDIGCNGHPLNVLVTEYEDACDLIRRRFEWGE